MAAPNPDESLYQYDIVVIGAGIAGLMASNYLSKAGYKVAVLEKSRGVGGRMATRRLGEAVCDHGTQYFSVKGRAFGSVVLEARESGAVMPWCDMFPKAKTLEDPAVVPLDEAGHARWKGSRGMTSLPKHLAQQLSESVKTGVRVNAVSIQGNSVHVSCENDEVFVARAALLTAPSPQIVEILTFGGLVPPVVDSVAWEALSSVEYSSCFSLMLKLKQPSLLPDPGGLEFCSGPVAWISDNFQKGISPVPSLTIQATAEFSKVHFDTDPIRVQDELTKAVHRWIDGDISNAIDASSLQRWKYAFPISPIKAPMIALQNSPPVVCCGDSFGGGRVESAASSGLAAARWIHRFFE
ncbi:MAG: FAD-dependent oxidoreductase [Planctomycetaceae bacterium]|nr:FAD-dependent oxidoreductase [Planctomycetaceae bacterium]